eukprot:13798647-Ditylum_brightwellii.AAC.1
MEAYQVLNNFDDFGTVHTGMANKIPKGQELDRSKIDNSLDFPDDSIDDTTLHIDRLPSVMPVSFENNLSTIKFCSERDIDEMYEYSNLMGYWADVEAFNYHGKKCCQVQR